MSSTATPITGKMAFTIDDTLWSENEGLEDPTGRLYLPGGITINGTHFHVEAIAVKSDDGLQEASSFELDDGLGNLQDYAVGAFETTIIRGREYVIVITPFCS